MSFTEFNLYQHRQAYLVSANCPGFFFKYFIKMSKQLVFNVKNLYSYRFIFSFFLINPFLYSKLKMKNFFFLEDFSLNFFYNNTLYINSIEQSLPILKDFGSEVNYCLKNKIFLDLSTLFNYTLNTNVLNAYTLCLTKLSFKNIFLIRVLFYVIFFNTY
jgi:hypothetical protein